MKALDILRDSLEGDVFGIQEAKNVLSSYKAINGIMSHLVRSGDVVRIRRGLYAFGKKHQRNSLLSYQISNLLYGPSYVSLHSMLAFYNLIPERVVEVTALNTKKTKLFESDLGRFRYRMIPSKAFSIGIKSIQVSGHSFIGATKEKAILDTLYLSDENNHYHYLVESLRIDPQELLKLDITMLAEISKAYNSESFKIRVASLIKELK